MRQPFGIKLSAKHFHVHTPSFAVRHWVDGLIILLSCALLAAAIKSAVENLLSGRWTGSVLVLWIDQTMINTTIVIMAVLTARKSFPLILLPLAFASGELIYNSGLLIFRLHDFLNHFALYHQLFGRHESQIVNPQYGMLVPYGVLLSILTIQNLFKKSRSFDRVIGNVVSLSVIGTFTLFHVFLIEGIQQYTKLEERTLVSVFADDEHQFLKNCHGVRASCFFVSYADTSKEKLTGHPINEIIQHTLSDIARDQIRLATPYTWSEQSIINMKTTFWVAAVMTHPDGMWLAVSDKDYMDAVNFEDFRFTVQSTFAHSTWLLIFIFVIAVHRKRLRKTVRNALPQRA